MGRLMQALVTGSEGFVGRHLCRALASRGVDVVGFDIKSGKDILQDELPDVDRVYHLAARTDAQNHEAWSDAEVNIMGTLRLLMKYRSSLVFASSSMVNYPSSPYAISKRAGEQYAKLYGAAVVRFCNIFGHGGHSVIDKFREADVLTINGSGTQLRTYAPIDDAINALLTIKPGELQILRGRDLTVCEIAKMFPGKRVVAGPKSELDLEVATQVLAA